MIEVVGLTKYYGDKPGVLDINFEIERGDTVGLLGPNGAGKSTIMKMLAGYMLPTSGSIQINDIDAIDSPKEAARHIGFMPEIPPLYTDMEVRKFLDFMAKINGVKSNERAEHLNDVMELASVHHVRKRLIGNLSKGYRQRVGLARALIGFPQVLILDEPTVGLDPTQITEVRNLIANLSQNHTILLSSHILSEIKMTCKKIIIINNGRLVLQDTVENLAKGGSSFSIRIKGEPEKVSEILTTTPGVSSADWVESKTPEESPYCYFMVNGDVGPGLREELFNRFAAAEMPIIELTTIGNRLEDVFLEFTSYQGAEAEED